MVIFKESRKRLGIGLIPGFFLLLLTFTSSAQSIFEQVGRLPVSVYSSEEYDGDPSVWTAIQNEEGLMYFGGFSGIHEYDGVSWRSLFDKHNTHSIRALAKDAEGRIFYSGTDFGYLMSNPKGEMQAVSLLHLVPEEVGSGIDIFSINFFDKYLFLQTRKNLIRVELAEDFSLKSFKTWPAETTFSYSFVQGDDFFIHQNERGLYRLIGEEITLVRGTEILGNDRVRIMLPYPTEGGKRFLFGGSSSGFYLFDGSSVSKFPTQVDDVIKGGAGLLYHALPYKGNYILSFTGAGIVIMSPRGEILKRIKTEQGLPNDGVTSVYLDKSRGLWATTQDGIARIAIDSPIQSFGKEHGITSGVFSIQKQDGEFFLGTSNGLLKFDTKINSFRSVEGIQSNQILDLTVDGEDLIIPVKDLNVYRDGKLLRLDFPKDGSMPSGAFVPKNNPNLLLVGTSTGLLLYERGLSKEFPWEFKGKVPGIGEIRQVFFEGKEGTIFSLGADGLYVFNISETRLEPIGTESIISREFKFSNWNSYSLIDGELYVKTSEGMRKFSEDEGDFFPTDDFKEVEKDILDFNQHKSGVIWYESPDKKKYILKRNAEGKFVKDERPNSIAPFLSQADFIDEDSILWFGTPKGLIRYDPKKDNQTDKEFFTLIRLVETKTDTLPVIAYGRDKTVSAREAKDNSYRFEFAAPYFEDEKKTKYQTYLEGFDPDWVDWNDNKFKEYTNLPPGPYTFHVRALAHTGRISEEAVYSFVVLPPWYATWWAYLLYALLIGGIITAIVKWRSQKLKAENRILEERVNERTAALEKSLADLKSTQSQLIHAEKMASLGELTAGIAHEIQNPLNFVNNFSEVSEELIEEMKEEIDRGNYDDVKLISDDLKENLSKIKFHGKRADGIVKSMLQHSRKDNGKKELTDINQVADEYLRLSYHGLRAKDKSFFADFHLDADPSLPKVEVIPQEIGRVLLNLINNAFYAASEKKKLLEESGNLGDFKPKVWVITKNESEGVTISIRDNGNGIPDDIKSKIFQPFFTTKPAGSGTGLGLSMSYDIITKGHQGRLEVESKTGEFTEFTIFLNTKKS
jgi:signal transduction histidine kinase